MAELDFPLLEWLEGAEDVQYNLASSSVKAITLSDLGGLPTDMELGYPEDEIEKHVEEKIANIYEDDVETIITPGAQAANSLIFDALLQNEDTVLVEDPAYTPLQTAPALKGAKVELFKRRYENGFKIEIEKIKERCSERTKMIILTNPHNPSGVFQDPEADDLRGLVSFIEENDIYLLIDEIYRDLVQGAKSCVSLSDNIVVSSSLSKCYGLGGLRFGWAVSTNEKLIQKLKQVRSHLSPKDPTPTLKIGSMALEERTRLLKRARDIAEKGRSLARGWVAGTPDVEWIEPSLGIISFPKLKMDLDGEGFAKRAKEAGVLVAPGSYFSRDDGFESHIRLTFGKDFNSTAQGFQQLSKVVKDMDNDTV